MISVIIPVPNESETIASVVEAQTIARRLKAEKVLMERDPTTSILAVIARLHWIMLGPMLLLVMTAMIVMKGAGWLSGASIGYLGVLAAMMFARWFEFWRGDPRTSDGQPATRQHLRRYLAVAAAIGLVVWFVANLLGKYVLAS